MDKICKKLLEGSFELPLAKCVVAQCGAENPIEYNGPGLLSQANDKSIELRVFSDGVDTIDALQRMYGRPLTSPGVIIPDTHYYDFEGIDTDGEKWFTNRISIKTEFGSGTYIQAKPWQLTKEVKKLSTSKTCVHAFVNRMIDLPWHVYTEYGEHSLNLNIFEDDTVDYEYKVTKHDDGIWINFASTKSLAIEDEFSKFLQALSILCGKNLTPVILKINDKLTEKTKLTSNLHTIDEATIPPPLKLYLGGHLDAHCFIKSFLALQSNTKGIQHHELIYRMWDRILKSRSNDIENSSLVLSVAIEGIINNVISLASDVDPAFVAQITEAKPAIENLSVGSRALDCLRSSLGNAIKPKPKDTLRRLEKTKVITKNHRDAWSEMRNLNAHGHLIELNNEELQKHLDRFHICLDLFYRLIFLPLEYRGQHRDYSSEKWPSREFIGEQ